MSRLATLILDKIFEQRDRLVALLPILFGTGIGIYFLLPFEPYPWVTVVLAEIVVILAYVWRFNRERLLIIGIIGIILAGFADIQLKSMYLRPPKDLLYTEQEAYIKGKIVKIDTNYKGKKRLVLKDITDFEDKPINGVYRITLNHNFNELKVGDCAELAVQTFPLMHPSIVGGYQFDRKAYFEGINALGYSLADAYPVECKNNDNFSGKISAIVYGLRKAIFDKINENMKPEEASVASALISGMRDNLGKNLSEKYQNSGLAHFLAISGLHMGMIAFLVFFFVRFFMAMIPPLALKYNSKKIAAITAIIFSFVYFVISGMQIPAERAFLMTLFILVGVMFNREAISIRTISIAAFIVLLISPQALISASFQMSFSAVLVMTAFYERYSADITSFFAKNRFYRYISGYLAGILISDFVATLATLPFSIYHFHKIAIYTLLGNLMAAPIIGFVVMPCVLLSLVLLPFGLEKFAFLGTEYGLELINRITSYVSSLPDAGFKIISMPFWGFLLIIFGGLWMCVWTAKWRRWGLLSVIIGFLSILTVRIPDFITNTSGDVFALKDNNGEIVILPSKGDNFVKSVWLETLAQDKISPKSQKVVENIYFPHKTNEKNENYLLDLQCNEKTCVYKHLIILNKSGGVEINGEKIDTENTLGFSAYINGKNVKINTVREYIGYRPWNI